MSHPKSRLHANKDAQELMALTAQEAALEMAGEGLAGLPLCQALCLPVHDNATLVRELMVHCFQQCYLVVIIIRST